MKGEILFLKPRSRRTTRQHNSPTAILNWRWFGNNKRQKRKAHIGGETTPFKQTSRETRKQLQQHESPTVRRLRSAGINEGRHRLTRTSSTMEAEGRENCSFLPSGHAVYCMLCCACFFKCFAFLAISLVIIPGTEGSKNHLLKMRAIGARKPEELFEQAVDHLGP